MLDTILNNNIGLIKIQSMNPGDTIFDKYDRPVGILYSNVDKDGFFIIQVAECDFELMNINDKRLR